MTHTRTFLAKFRLPALLLPTLLLGLPAAGAATVPTAQLTSSLQWRSVGPYVGGRVITVTGVTQQPNLFYLGATGGGVWESEDYGKSWKNISDKYFSSNNIGAIAVAPSNPKVIYVGTGESDIRNTFLTGDGMYKSTDAGKTWTHIGLEDTHIISWIVVDPTNPDVVYVAALGHIWAPNPERGVYKTTDGGKTWKKILYVNDKTGAITLALDPSNPQILYATMWQAYRRHWTLSSGGPGSGIYKTSDGGATWINITHSQGLPTGIFGKVGVAVAPSSPNVVYALIQANYQGKPGGLFRSDNAGKSWTLVNNSDELTQRAFYYMRVYVDPKDANTIYLPNVDVYVSHDGGKTIKKLHPPHGDNHAFWINPNDPQVFIEGNDGGATVTRDGGKTWSSEENQPTGQFYHVNLNIQFPFDIYGAQQDEGADMGPSAVRFGKIPPVWERAAGGESSWVVPQPEKWWITYGSGYFSLMDRYDSRTGVDQSIDPSPIYHDGAPASELTYRSGWIHHPILFAPNNPNELLQGTQYVLKSMDYGQSWTAISPDLTRNDKSKQALPGGSISADVAGSEIYDTISAMAVSPFSDDIIWTGSDDGLVHVTTDGGTHWNAVTPQGLPKWITITCIEASHSDPGTAYLTASHYQWDDFKPYVYITTDYGKHWTTLDKGLPTYQYLESIRQDPNDPDLLFLGTSKTVFMSLDGGAQWQPLTLNLPPVRVSDIGIQAAQHAVVLATHGRGFWILDNLQFLEQLAHVQVADTAPYLFAPQQTWLLIRSSSSSDDNSPGGSNAPSGTTVFFYLPSGYTDRTPVTLSFTTAEGQVINSFTLPVVPKPNGTTNKVEKPKKPPSLHPGVNRFQWDLRYKPAVYVKGYFVTEDGLDAIVPPTVIPGTYYAVLDYNGTFLKQPFEVKLDPRLTITQEQLQARFDLLMKINDTLNSLDTLINQALDARARLQKALTNRSVSARRAREVLATLDRDIGDLVQLKIQSGEGDLVYETKVMERLTLLAADIEQSYTPLKPQNVLGFSVLSQHAQAGEARLQADVQEANRLLGN